MWVNDEHLEKAFILMDVTDGGILICISDEHSEKAFIPIEVTDDGIAICFIFLLWFNNFALIVRTFNNK